MNKKFKALTALTLFVTLYVACEHLLHIVEKSFEIGYLAQCALFVIKFLLVVHILVDVCEAIFETELKKPLVEAIKNLFKIIIEIIRSLFIKLPPS